MTLRNTPCWRPDWGGALRPVAGQRIKDGSVVVSSRSPENSEVFGVYVFSLDVKYLLFESVWNHFWGFSCKIMFKEGRIAGDERQKTAIC